MNPVGVLVAVLVVLAAVVLIQAWELRRVGRKHTEALMLLAELTRSTAGGGQDDRAAGASSEDEF